MQHRVGQGVDLRGRQGMRCGLAVLGQHVVGTVRETKRLMKRHDVDTILATIGVEGAVFCARLRSPETKETFTAFFEKRKPDFTKFREFDALKV